MLDEGPRRLAEQLLVELNVKTESISGPLKLAADVRFCVRQFHQTVDLAVGGHLEGASP